MDACEFGEVGVTLKLFVHGCCITECALSQIHYGVSDLLWLDDGLSAEDISEVASLPPSRLSFLLLTVIATWASFVSLSSISTFATILIGSLGCRLSSRAVFSAILILGLISSASASVCALLSLFVACILRLVLPLRTWWRAWRFCRVGFHI